MWPRPPALRYLIGTRRCFSGRRYSLKPLYLLVIPARFERTTYRLGICRSIQLSYGTNLMAAPRGRANLDLFYHGEREEQEAAA